MELVDKLNSVSLVSKAQYLLLTSVYELEAQVIDALKVKLPLPLYTVGPPIPYLDPKDNSSVISSNHDIPDYIEWLNSQRKGSVLYVSMGSFLSVSSSQLNEIVAGVHNSGVRFLWVSRGETTLFKDGYGDMGQVVQCNCERVDHLTPTLILSSGAFHKARPDEQIDYELNSVIE
ncbi:UDP-GLUCOSYLTRANSFERASE FAMILY PROTEIN [Salix purpurea]|uniref:UDP-GLUCOSYLTRANSFERASE FAMILY PROTEIN n=1 Tax=Salix purpurea TaxID=77065 RepID=A0A9Q0PQP1_SALPP|nr:UDP-GLUCOSYLTRANSFERASE FAMILY PROTEIN [Salix purpurea]